MAINLPNYFLADLPTHAELSASLITEACQTLKRNRERYLVGRSTEGIIRLISRVAEEWLAPESKFRLEALHAGPAATGFSAPVIAAGLDPFFDQLTQENIEAFLHQELGNRQRLDSFQADERQVTGKRVAMAFGPALLAQIAPGNIPNATLTPMILGLLTRSAQFIKCATGGALIPRLFAHSLYEADAKLGACIEVAEWKGGNDLLETALFAEADCVMATGSDEMLDDLRRRVPGKTRFLGYGTRVSFGYITRDSLEHDGDMVAQRAAADIVAWNQRGCLSPHVIYVEDAGQVTADAFAALLAGQLDLMEKSFPRGALAAQEAAAIATRRAFFEVRAAHSLETKLWASLNSTAWTVVMESDPRFHISCLNRFIYIKAVANLNHALLGAELVREKVSTIGVSAASSQWAEVAQQLARWGARRICPLGQMQQPPLGWRHDGRPALGDLVTWTDWERP